MFQGLHRGDADCFSRVVTASYGRLAIDAIICSIRRFKRSCQADRPDANVSFGTAHPARRASDFQRDEKKAGTPTPRR